VPEIDQGIPLEAEIEFRPDPKELAAGVKKLDLWQSDASLTLHLVNARTEKALAAEPVDPTQLKPAHDSGSEALPLEGSSIRPPMHSGRRPTPQILTSARWPVGA
jgi:hypothetical protein